MTTLRLALLTLAVVGGILTAIAVPNIWNAVQRGKQRRSLALLRTLGTAVEEYSIDHKVYPAVADGGIEALRPHVVPEYLTELRVVDGWGNRIRFRSDGETYELRSLGSDGREEPNPTGGHLDGFAFDLIFRDGGWWQTPHGL